MLNEVLRCQRGIKEGAKKGARRSMKMDVKRGVHSCSGEGVLADVWKNKVC